MAELGDIKNEFVRGEVEEYIEREDERAEIITLIAKSRASMQEIAAGINRRTARNRRRPNESRA